MDNLLWITNQPKSIKSLWPRRIGVEYIEGPPKATSVYSVEELAEQKLIGVYVRMNEEEYRKLPLARNQEEFKE